MDKEELEVDSRAILHSRDPRREQERDCKRQEML